MVTRKQYTKEFKLDAISLILDQGFTDSKSCQEPGNQGKHAWSMGQAFCGNGKLTPEQEEIRRLRIENKQLKLER